MTDDTDRDDGDDEATQTQYGGTEDDDLVGAEGEAGDDDDERAEE